MASYCNDTQVEATPWDVMIVFTYSVPNAAKRPSGSAPAQTAEALMHRVVMSPQSAKALCRRLSAKIEEWESTNQTIELPERLEVHPARPAHVAGEGAAVREQRPREGEGDATQGDRQPRQQLGAAADDRSDGADARLGDVAVVHAAPGAHRAALI